MATNIGSIIPTRTAAEWRQLNPMLVKGQLVHESDTGAFSGSYECGGSGQDGGIVMYLQW